MDISYGIERECAFFAKETNDKKAAQMALKNDTEGIFRGTSCYMDIDHYEIITLPAYNLTDAVRSAWDIDARQKRICRASGGTLMAFKGNVTPPASLSACDNYQTFGTHDNFVINTEREFLNDIVFLTGNNALSNMLMARGILCGEGGYFHDRICHSPRIETLSYGSCFDGMNVKERRIHINASMDNCSPISTGLRIALGEVISSYMYVKNTDEKALKRPKSVSDISATVRMVNYLIDKVKASRSLKLVPPNTDTALYILDVIKYDLKAGVIPLYLDWGAKHAYLSRFPVEEREKIMAEDINWCRLDKKSTWHRIQDICLSDPKIAGLASTWMKRRSFRGFYRHIIGMSKDFITDSFSLKNGTLVKTSSPQLTCKPPSCKTGKCFILPRHNLDERPVVGKIIKYKRKSNACVVKVGDDLITVSEDQLIQDTRVQE